MELNGWKKPEKYKQLWFAADVEHLSLQQESAYSGLLFYESQENVMRWKRAEPLDSDLKSSLLF